LIFDLIINVFWRRMRSKVGGAEGRSLGVTAIE